MLAGIRAVVRNGVFCRMPRQTRARPAIRDLVGDNEGVSDLIDTTEMYLRTIYELSEEGIVPMRARITERLGRAGPPCRRRWRGCSATVWLSSMRMTGTSS